MTSVNIQKDLRRISLNRRAKNEAARTAGEKINSPLAKYDQQGNLHCVICKTKVKSASIWKVHINTANHKLKVESTRQHKNEILEAKPICITKPLIDKAKGGQDVRGEQQSTIEYENKNKTVTSSLNFSKEHLKEGEENAKEQELPDNFFDVVKDSEKDKEAMDGEWQRFQREIKEQTSMSTAIEAFDNDHTAVDRQFEEIDEQILCWSKVKILEEKKEMTIRNRPPKRKLKEEDEDIESDDEINIDEFPNWRSKKLK